MLGIRRRESHFRSGGVSSTVTTERRRRRNESKRSVWDPQSLIPVRDDNRDIGRHPRFEAEIVILYANHDVVRHNILYRQGAFRTCWILP